jgi:hypothetical protein
MTREEKNHYAEIIKLAFEEGYNSYASPASPYNTVEEAWLESAAKVDYDKLLSEVS